MVINFGLQNTPATFQRVMNKLLQPIKAKYRKDVQGYMNDVLIATKNDLEYHWKVVKAVLSIMKKESFFLKSEKCEFEKWYVEYLGMLLEDGTIQLNPSKVAGLKEWPITLKSVKEVWSTLEVLGYQQAFIAGFAKIAKPLTNLLKKNQPFKWTNECTDAIKELIHCVTTHPILIHLDPTKTFKLEVDASNYTTGAILFQRDNKGKPCPIGYNSRTFNEAEWQYDIYDKKLTAIN